MEVIEAVHYRHPEDSQFDPEINARFSEFFTRSVQAQTLDLAHCSTKSLIAFLDQCHEHTNEDDVPTKIRKVFAFTRYGQWPFENAKLMEMRRWAGHLRDQGYGENADATQRCFEHYALLLSLFSVALDVCKPETIKKVLLKKNPLGQLQKKIDQGVLKKYGPEFYARFCQGQPVDNDPVAHAENIRNAEAWVPLAYDNRLFTKWRQSAAPLYILYLHPRRIPAALDEFTKTLNRRLKNGEDLIQIAAWAYCELINIHPYKDGNGRVARAFLNYLLATHDRPTTLLYSPSNSDCVRAGGETILHRLLPEAQAAKFDDQAFYRYLQGVIQAAE